MLPLSLLLAPLPVLKRLCHAIWHIFKRLIKKVSSHQLNSKIMVQFCYGRLSDGTETASCRVLQWIARMEMD